LSGLFWCQGEERWLLKLSSDLDSNLLKNTTEFLLILHLKTEANPVAEKLRSDQNITRCRTYINTELHRPWCKDLSCQQSALSASKQQWQTFTCWPVALPVQCFRCSCCTRWRMEPRWRCLNYTQAGQGVRYRQNI
jgi:hypothetical protein